ncbi:MAG: hypothetical protein GY719_14425 [bacterium]|nr:hypothetical protein [bacterium]
MTKPGVFEPGGAAENERRAAHVHFQAKSTSEEDSKFNFKAYKEPEIKAALLRLFHGKCAYCESRFSATQPMDVEHWRPKSVYWWLAATWDNLLPSCSDCNRKRAQVVLGFRTDDLEKPKTRKGRPEETWLTGKAASFPLAHDSQRATRPDEESREQPLLLDPCTDDPDEHLEFLPLTDFEQVAASRGPGRRRPMFALGVVRARRTATGQDPKALASINVYGLNRSGLVQARAERRLLIQRTMHTLVVLARLLQEFVSEDSDWRLVGLVEDLISHEMTGLARFMRPDQPFAALAGQIIKPFIEEITAIETDPG